jgi:hypothetical protein
MAKKNKSSEDIDYSSPCRQKNSQTLPIPKGEPKPKESNSDKERKK